MNGIIVVGLIYKSTEKSTENFSVALQPSIFSLDPCVKTYIMGDFNLTFWMTIFHHQSKILSIKWYQKISYQSLIAPVE